MSNIKACIFDLDGVLVDTTIYHYLAWKRLANELGFDFSEQQNEELKGVSRMKSLEILLAIGNLTVSEDMKKILSERKNQWYCEHIGKITEDVILPGAKELIEKLRDKKIKIALGSASKNAITILKNIDLIRQFDVIIDGNKVTNAKPDPEVFLLAAKELGVDPKECVVFEDAQAGIEAAVNAGMASVGVGDPLLLFKADIVISSLEKITLDEIYSINRPVTF